VSNSEHYTLRCVVVDDSVASRRILVKILESAPVDVVAEADDVDSAVELCRREKPDILFLDVVMPGGSGVDVLAALHDMIPGIRVLMVTSIDERDTITACRNLGAVGYILKPYSRDKVLAYVQQVSQEIISRRGAPNSGGETL